MTRLISQRQIAGLLIVLGVLLLAAAAFVLFWFQPSGESTDSSNGFGRARLQLVRTRGHLRCGVEGGLPGFSMIESEPQLQLDNRNFYQSASGLDADFCRAIAVAIFGDFEGKIFFTPVRVDERFDVVLDGTVDVLLRNTTWTAGRETQLDVTFGPIIFHDGQKFLTSISTGIDSLAEMNGTTICVLPDTTSILNVQNKLNEEGITYTLISERRPDEGFRDGEDVVEGYLRQKCEVMTGDESHLIGRLSEQLDPSEHVIFPEQAISYEPLAPVVSDRDPHWRNVVNYAVWATIRADELSITSANLDDFDASSPLDYKQFLGIEEDAAEPRVGTALGLQVDFARNIVAKVGSYSEIFERNLGSTISERGPNQVWVNDPRGRLYSPPWLPLSASEGESMGE